jgi:hypothetical protein
METPIRLKDLALTYDQFLTIRNYTVNDGTVVVDTLYRDPAFIQADFFHTKSTNERIAVRNAVDLTVRLLRSGVRIIFNDGHKSTREIQKFSQPLYDKFYNP